MGTDTTQRRHYPALWLAPVLALGLITLFGSESVEEDDRVPEPPVTVTFVLGSLAAPFERDRGDDIAEVSDMRISGEYTAGAGDTPSLDRDTVTVDGLTGFTVDITPSDPADLLTGVVSMDVSEPVAYRYGSDPTAGRFTTLFEGTTTIVRTGNDVTGAAVTTGGQAERVLSWGDFRAAQDDTNENLDVRMASYAFGVLETVYDAAVTAERTHRDIRDNRVDLEGVGTGELLSRNCATPAGGSAGERALIWKVDAAGTGQGSAGDGDRFEVAHANCLFTDTGEFVDGGIELTDFLFVDTSPKSLGASVELTSLFVSGQSISGVAQPAPGLPRLDGQFSLIYRQEIATPATR